MGLELVYAALADVVCLHHQVFSYHILDLCVRACVCVCVCVRVCTCVCVYTHTGVKCTHLI